MTPVILNASDAGFPARLRERLGSDAPAQIFALGNLGLLALPKTALFCSARCPGDAILRAYDQAARWRDAGHCVISGFHFPVEKECLRILLRGTQSIIICPARSSPQRAPAEWKKPLANGRLLILSCFTRANAVSPPNSPAAATNSSPRLPTKSGSRTSPPAVRRNNWQRSFPFETGGTRCPASSACISVH